MARRRFNPPLNKRYVATSDGYDIFIVDAHAIRNASQPDEEFDNVATHEDFPDIVPERHIWTSQATWKKEGRFFVANAVTELQAREAGLSKDKAFDAGNAADRHLRQEVTGIEYRDGRPHRRVPKEIYIRRYCTLPDPQFLIDVWIIDGCRVRCYYKTDYTEGGHGYVYPWVPKGQIWVESSVDRQELPYIIAHEYIEHRLMRDEGLEYDRAHEICAEVEFDLRKAPSRVEFPGLSRNSLTKGKLPTLTSLEFFEFVKSKYRRGFVRRARALMADTLGKVGL
jgi:hypothetical protein